MVSDYPSCFSQSDSSAVHTLSSNLARGLNPADTPNMAREKERYWRENVWKTMVRNGREVGRAKELKMESKKNRKGKKEADFKKVEGRREKMRQRKKYGEG